MGILENVNLILKYYSSNIEKKIARILFSKSMQLSVAESCTGGLISSRLTDIPGSSAYTKENYITYANEAKIKLLNVSTETLKEHGAVSEQCALEMVQGLFKNVKCDVALATTGLAGPDGGTEEKPVGTIYVAIKTQYKTIVEKYEFPPKLPRKTLKLAFSQAALELLLNCLKDN